MDINIIDNSGLPKDELHDVCLRALEKCGLTGEGYAKRLAPVDTGRLRSDVSHAVNSDDLSVDIGTAVEYTPYVKLRGHCTLWEVPPFRPLRGHLPPRGGFKRFYPRSLQGPLTRGPSQALHDC